MSRRDDWVACVGPIAFPWGEPGSRRVFGLVASLAAAGRNVVVASGDPGPRLPVPLHVDGAGSVCHVGLGEAPPSGAGPLRASARMFLTWGRRTVRWLDEQPTKPSHVLLHGGQAQYAHRLLRWCHRNGVPLVADVVDWYNGRYVRGGVLGPLNISMQTALRHHYPRCDAVIAISSLLERHYLSRVGAVIRIPPTTDVQHTPVGPPRTCRGPALTLVYAGSPGRNNKDLLATVMTAVGKANSADVRVELRIIGPSADEVRSMAGGQVPEGVRVMGRMAQRQVPAALREADFTVLLRRPERASDAGFSTKFCESLANGVPVLANLTSDMGSYLRDGVEGLVCPDYSVTGLMRTVQRAARLTDRDLTMMRLAAREQALKSFDYRMYADSLDAFFDAVRR
ncbi:glycosyltransferase [Micromonospora sp. CNB394]|uniref:glycosyltransferase n=1 Tax=Micromonospora sp. CNB394 TaxID=1169151 RepID=UPI0003667DB1|nr:glycosyltransferase [Micromonospora sp. CNB394]